MQLSVTSADGVRLDVVHEPRPESAVAAVFVPGFSGWSGRPAVARVRAALAAEVGVLQVDLRGHGRSEGRCTFGDREVLDLDATVALARELGYQKVVSVGFSMGGSVVLRHAASVGEWVHSYPVRQPVDAVVSVSATSRWFVRDTRPMRRLHWMAETRLGRQVARRAFGVRIDPAGWLPPLPLSPVEAAGRLTVPLLVVHGDRDAYFPVEHPQALADAARAAGGQVQLWLEAGFGHAEEAASPQLLARLASALPALAGARAAEASIADQR